MSSFLTNVQELYTYAYDMLRYEVVHNPFHVLFDIVMVAAIVYFVRQPVHKANDKSKLKPTKEEEEEMIAEFQSAPFAFPDREDLPEPPVVDSYEGARATLENGKQVLNAASFDFLSYATHPKVVEVAQSTIVKYGCGSCGPRGFYGSLKPHLDVEERIAKFTNTAAAIIYSFSFATVSTLIPCFTSRGDEILVDERCNLTIQIGCRLSRSHTHFFSHNNTDELERLMKASHEKQKKKGKRYPPRRLVVVEGLYRNTGCIANLKKIAALCKTYKFRLLVDDSLGFGAVGATGRGTPELMGVPMDDVDIYVGAMSTALGAVGGFCAGAAAMVDHQRLAATGYVFSASLPPYASAAAEAILDEIDASPERPVRLQENAKRFRQLFEASAAGSEYALPKGVVMLTNDASAASPVVHFATANGSTLDAKTTRARFFAAADELLAEGVMTVGVKYNDQEREPQPAPTLRVTMKSEFTTDEVAEVAQKVAAMLRKKFNE